MDIPAELLIHTANVKTYEGTSAKGDTFAAPVDVACFVEDQRKLVLSPDGDQVVSETTLYAHLDDAAKFTVKSQLTLPSGRRALVIIAKRRDDGGMGAPQHVEVACS